MGEQLPGARELQILPPSAPLNWYIDSVRRIPGLVLPHSPRERTVYEIRELVHLQAYAWHLPRQLDELAGRKGPLLRHILEPVPRRRRPLCCGRRPARVADMAPPPRPARIPHLPDLGGNDDERELEVGGLARRYGRWRCLPR